jgi:hypothetical protein
LLAQKGVPHFVLTGITRVANGTAAINEFLSIVEDFVIAVLANEVVVVQATGQRQTRQKDCKTHGHESAASN